MLKRGMAALLALALILACALALAEYPLTVTDQTGREVTIKARPERIVSGYYISTSACIALGLSDRMAAVEAKAEKRSIYRLSAPRLAALPNVGTAKAFDLEACLAVKPDLVILPKRLKDTAKELEAFDIPVLLVYPEDNELLAQMIGLIGEAADVSERAQELNAFAVAQLALLGEKLAGETPVSALMLGASAYLSCATGEMYQTALLENAGAVNAAAELGGTSAAVLSYEALLAMNPQALIIPSEAAYTASDVLNDPELAALDAVVRGAVYEMPRAFEAWDSPVPSGMLGALWLGKTLHAQAYGEELYRDAARTLYETYYGFTPDEDAL